MAVRWSLAAGTLERDLALAGGSFVGGLVLLGLDIRPQAVWYPAVDPKIFLLTLAGCSVAVALRRASTGASLTIGTVAVLVDLAFGGSLGAILVYTQVLYDACVYGPPRMWRWLLRVTVAISLLGAAGGVVYFGNWRGVAVGVPTVLIGVLSVLTGISVRQYRDQAAAERARAEQTARLVELDRRQAVNAERTRMARELHDVIANHLSAVAIHATAALSVRSLDRGQVDDALRVIRENSVQGLAEMRQMIGLLREPPRAGAYSAGGPEADPTGTSTEEVTRVRLAEVDRLVDRVRAAGLTVLTEVRGEPRPLPVSVDLAAYRIVQESLTNALKHGRGEASLRIGYQPDAVTVTVRNAVRTGANASGAAGPAPQYAGATGQRTGAAGQRTAVTSGAGLAPSGTGSVPTSGAGSATSGPDTELSPTGVPPAPAEAGPGGTGTRPGDLVTGPGGAGAGLIGMRERANLLGGRFEAGPDGGLWRVHAELPVTGSDR